MKHGKVLTIANVAMFLLFVSWALFQYNDADFFVWALIYSMAALCCILFFMGRLSPTFGAAIAVIALVWALVLGYFVLTAGESFSFVDDNIGEMAREAIGLLVVAAWTGFLARKTTIKKHRSSTT